MGRVFDIFGARGSRQTVNIELFFFSPCISQRLLLATVSKLSPQSNVAAA